MGSGWLSAGLKCVAYAEVMRCEVLWVYSVQHTL